MQRCVANGAARRCEWRSAAASTMLATAADLVAGWDCGSGDPRPVAFVRRGEHPGCDFGGFPERQQVPGAACTSARVTAFVAGSII